MTRAARLSRLLLFVVLLAGGAVSWTLQARPSEAAPRAPGTGLQWFKGNTHTHTVSSDGDSTPDEVAAWYREHGYSFVVLTDHNVLAQTDVLNAKRGADGRFLVIAGEEVTDAFDGKPVHTNGIAMAAKADPQHGASVLDVMQRNVDAIRRSGGVPHLNHPNFGWAITGDDLRQVERDTLFEIFNGHPLANNVGGGGVPGLEEVWDRILSSGKVLYGIADDDAHQFRASNAPDAAAPGRGWVFVHADRLAAGPIAEALDRGDFYSSTGVELSDYQVTDAAIALTVREEHDSKYRVQFIGRNGRVLKEVDSGQASYAFCADDLYVRAKVFESTGRVAWTQPVFPRTASQ